MKLRRLIVIAGILFLNSQCMFFNSGTVRYASIKEKGKGIYLIGYIENRDSYFDPYGAKNLVNMLKFEFIRSGYDILQLEDVLKSQEPNPFANASTTLPQGINENKNPQAVTGSETPSITKIAGEKTIFSVETEPKILRAIEIKNLANNVKFDYYIQGAVAMNDNRKLLNKKESGIIFLEIYDKNGKITGSLNYTVEDRVFTEAVLLKDVCTKIVKKIDLKDENEQWWKFWI